MSVKKITISFVLTILCFGCTSEPDLHTYTTYVTNQSSSVVSLKGYDGLGGLVYEEILNISGKGEDCIVSSESFGGLSCGGLDSLVVMFENGKGYSCIKSGISNFNFENKDPLDPIESNFTKINNNTFEFIITQDDYMNALELF